MLQNLSEVSGRKRPGTLYTRVIRPVVEFLKYRWLFTADRPIAEVLKEVQETLQRYNYVSQELAKRRQRLTLKRPEIQKSLEAVELLIKRSNDGSTSVSASASSS